MADTKVKGTMDRAKGKAEQLKGRAKEKFD